MDLNKINSQIENEFKVKRERADARAKAAQARAQGSRVYHDLNSLEKELILKIASAKTNGENTKDLEKVLLETQNRKLLVLKKLGISEADLEPKFECKKCNDVGFVNGVMCQCFKRRRTEEILKASGLGNGEILTLKNFETTAKNKQQSEFFEKLKNKLELWCEKFPTSKNLIFQGKTGVGKTFSAKCIAGEIAKKGFEVLFVSAYEMSSMFLKYHTTFSSQKEAFFAPLVEADLLVVDDLGTEPPYKDVVFDYLYLLLSERERFARPTVITTNLLPSQIMDYYGERIYSRIFNKKTSVRLQILGDDLRV
ncbi:MAG: ATP-binding protein [Clostridia bacterium]|nr:ATP-binding protein [Clostridia bacterium]